MINVNRLICRIYAWTCERLYHEFAGFYDVVAWGVSGGAWAAWRRVAFDFVVGVDVLELGTGTGHLLVEGRQRSLQIVGVDLSADMLSVASKHVRKAGLSSCLVQADVESLPLPPTCIDTIIATFPAPYILSQATLHECVRVLRSSTARLVIVGLWVQPDWTRPLPFPVLYGKPSDAMIRRITEVLVGAGFDPPMLHAVEAAGASVGVLVASPRRTS